MVARTWPVTRPVRSTFDAKRHLFIGLISIQEVVQEAAAYGSIAPSDTDGIRDRIRESSDWMIDFSSLPDEQIEIKYIGPACAGNTIEVEIDYDHSFIGPFFYGYTIPFEVDAKDTILTPGC